MDDLLGILIDAAILVVPILAVVVARVLIRYINTLDEKAGDEIGEAQWNNLKDWAAILIRAAEQKVNPETTGISDPSVLNELRKDFVLQHIHQLVAQLDLPIEPNQVDALVEGIYNKLKEEKIILTAPVIEITEG